MLDQEKVKVIDCLRSEAVEGNEFARSTIFHTLRLVADNRRTVLKGLFKQRAGNSNVPHVIHHRVKVSTTVRHLLDPENKMTTKGLVEHSINTLAAVTKDWHDKEHK